MNKRVDIAIIGSGAAGIAAAVCAARAGCSTLLLDKNNSSGGTGGFSGLTTLCGLFDDKGNFLNAGFAREFAEAIAETAPVQMGKVWVLPYRPEKFRAAAEKFLTSTPNLQTRWNTLLEAVVLENNHIVCINGIQVGAVIDCTGTAEVARSVGADCLMTDASTQAPAVIFPLQHVAREFYSPADAAHVLLPLARAGFPPLNFQASLEPNTLTVKFTGRTDQVSDVIRFLRANIAGFENCSTPLKEFTEARRAGHMIIGQHLLTGDDILAGKKFPDKIASGAWPIEQWNADGVVRYKYLPPGTHYEIPARSLRAANVENLFMAGKTISADVDAIASARVMGICLATGEAAGNLAASHLESAHAK
ncbi:MAG: FAD-dependent oxidoreductase [Limisphaerales bacterium]